MAGLFTKWVEKQAGLLREKLSLDSTAPLNPFELAEEMEIIVITPQDIENLLEETRNQLLQKNSDGWSAGTLCMPNGRYLVVMNNNHAQTRQHATLMEEIAHIFLKHKPSKLSVINAQFAKRTYDQKNEKEAYWVGAAALVPERVLNRAIENKMTRVSLAKYCCVSNDLVKFRESILHLRLMP